MKYKKEGVTPTSPNNFPKTFTSNNKIYLNNKDIALLSFDFLLYCTSLANFTKQAVTESRREERRSGSVCGILYSVLVASFFSTSSTQARHARSPHPMIGRWLRRWASTGRLERVQEGKSSHAESGRPAKQREGRAAGDWVDLRSGYIRRERQDLRVRENWEMG